MCKAKQPKRGSEDVMNPVSGGPPSSSFLSAVSGGGGLIGWAESRAEGRDVRGADCRGAVLGCGFG